MKKISYIFLPAIISMVFAGAPSAGFAQTANNEFKNTVNKLLQTRQEFKDKKAQEGNAEVEESKAKTQAERLTAQQKRVEAQKSKEEKRKEVLLKSVEIQINWMNRTKERVNKMSNIEAALKTDLNTKIANYIAELEKEKTKVNAATTAEALKTLAVEIRNLFKSQHDIVKQIVDAIHDSQEVKALSKAEDRAAAIKAKLEELKAAGKNVSALEVDLENAKKKIEDARLKIGQKEYESANDILKNVYQIFRSIADKAKSL